MSYDLWFYRSTSGEELPLGALQSLAESDGEGAARIRHEEIREALREVFGADFSAENDGLHGPMFSILLPPGASDYLVRVNCAWDVTKRIDIYARLVAVGVRWLAAFCFDPQSGEHVVPPDELPEAPRLAPAAEFQHAMSEFYRLSNNEGPASEVRSFRRRLERLASCFPEDYVVAKLLARVRESFPNP